MALSHGLLALLLVAHAIGTVTALVGRGALGRALVAGGGLVGALAALGLGAASIATGAVPTLDAGFFPLTGLALRVDGLHG